MATACLKDTLDLPINLHGWTGEKILINGVFSAAVGHIVEAFAASNVIRWSFPGALICVILNDEGPLVLAECVRHLDVRVVGIRVKKYVSGSFDTELDVLSSTRWSLVWTLRDESFVSWNDPGLKAFHLAFRQRIKAADSVSGFLYRGSPPWPIRGPAAPRECLQFRLPASMRSSVAAGIHANKKTVRIMLLTGGATHRKAPSINFWMELLSSLERKYDKPHFVLVGMTRGKTGNTQNITHNDIICIRERFVNVTDCFDIGILDQLAVAETCDLFISPHSGMGFAVLCVGVPWLTISGWQIPEYFATGVPFSSIMPQCPQYPCTPEGGAHATHEECLLVAEGNQDRPLKCFSDSALLPRIPEIVAEAVMLIEGRRTFSECIYRHNNMLGVRICGIPDHEPL